MNMPFLLSILSFHLSKASTYLPMHSLHLFRSTLVPFVDATALGFQTNWPTTLPFIPSAARITPGSCTRNAQTIGRDYRTVVPFLGQWLLIYKSKIVTKNQIFVYQLDTKRALNHCVPSFGRLRRKMRMLFQQFEHHSLMAIAFYTISKIHELGAFLT